MRNKKISEATYLESDEIENMFSSGSWQKILYFDFYSALTSEVRPFPCIFGVQGVKMHNIKYGFLETLDAAKLGPILKNYILNSRDFGPNTSLVVFTKPKHVRSIEYYHQEFWNLLKQLSNLDDQRWPDQIPQNTADRHWEFCYAGEPIFVVCNTPAHVFRLSRRSTSLMFTFQPRWVFDGILGTEKKAKKSISTVRNRLKPYDIVSASPDLGRYGDTTILESRQYFLDDKNQSLGCPFQFLKEDKSC